VTSVPPRYAQTDDRKNATRAILRSWSDLGLAAVSVNPASEAAPVQAAFPELVVRPAVAASSRLFPDRYGPSLRDAFDACRTADLSVLINADIHLVKGAAMEEVRRHPAVFYAARRTDIASVGGASLGVYRRGVDAVFFHPQRYAPLIDDPDIGRLQLGAPFWDIVVPVAASFHGDVRFLRPPVAAHVSHVPQWSPDDYDRLRAFSARTMVDHAVRFAGSSARAALFLRVARELVARPEKLAGPREIKAIARLVGAWLRRIEELSEVAVALDRSDPVLTGIAASLGGDLERLAGQESNGGMAPRRTSGLLGGLREALRRRRQRRGERRWQSLLADLDAVAPAGDGAGIATVNLAASGEGSRHPPPGPA